MEKYIGWLNDEGKNKKTIRAYSKDLDKLIKWYEETEGENFWESKVTTLHMHEFVSYLDTVGKYEPAYINRIIASLKTYFKYCMEKNLITYNPMTKVKMKRTMKQYASPKWLTKLEAAKFFHSIEQEKNDKVRFRDMSICRLMGGAGLRVHEVSDLNIDDINLTKRNENVIVRSGKGNKYRIIPLNDDIIEALQEWLNYRNASNSSDALFLSEKNTRLSDRAMRNVVVKYASAAGLSEVSPHTLRHTFGKNLADRGYGLQIIAELMGHESLETTRRYTQPGMNDLRKAVKSISEVR